jgi:hypothetical protein
MTCTSQGLAMPRLIPPVGLTTLLVHRICLDARFYYIRECVESGMIEVQHVYTEEQLADILTKSLPRLKFLKIRENTGVQINREGQQD